MEVAKKAKLSQKILISVLTVILLFNFIAPTVVRADDDDDIGGGLFTPIQYLLVGLGDAIMKLMQIAFTGNNKLTTTVTPTDASDVTWLPPDSTFDWENDVEWGIIDDDEDDAEVDVPSIKISPESIFSGRIPAFDINFFTPQEDIDYENWHWENRNKEIIQKSEKTVVTHLNDITSSDDDTETVTWKEGEWEEGKKYSTESYETILTNNGWEQDTSEDSLIKAWRYKGTGEQDGDVESIRQSLGNKYTFKWVEKNSETGQQMYYVLEYEVAHDRTTTKEIHVATLYKSEIVKIEESEGTRHSTAGALRDTIAYWYNILRNIAIVGLLSVLVYIGIRIVLSSAASDKSKYKEMLKDWAVAMFLLFAMHYFMSFTVTIIGSLTEALVPQGNLVVTESGITEELYKEDSTNIPYIGDRLIGDVRIKLQTGDALQRMAYTIIYIVLIVYTFIFALMYLKRVLYMAFFTMMAPLVALMYPLDKVRDGKAQAFDMWMKEYTFNALIQPFHLIIYYVVVSSAIGLAVDNPIYAIVAIGFMMPAEKLLRKFFGFNKSETTGVLGGAFGGAMLMQGINYLRKGGKSSGGKKANGSGASEQEAKKQLRTADSGNNMNKLLGDIGEEGEIVKQASSIKEDETNKTPEEKLNELSEREVEKKTKQLDDEKEENSNKYRITDIPKEDEDTYYSNDEPIRVSNDKYGEETHKFKAAATMAGRWALKGGTTALKLTARGFAAATLGTVGIAAGLASDDYSNVFKYGAAGIAAGNAVAGTGINKLSNLPSNAYRIKKAREEERRRYEEIAYNAGQRKILNNKRADEQFLKDKEAIKLYKAKFKEDYENAMRQALQYRSYGITDNDAIIKAMKLDTKGLPANRADKRRILIAGTASELGRKDIDQYGERLMKRGFSSRDAELMKKAVRDYNDFE